MMKSTQSRLRMRGVTPSARRAAASTRQGSSKFGKALPPGKAAVFHISAQVAGASFVSPLR
ncbi:hypothetical protein D3C72_2500610 [compost metagenome]